MPDLVAPAAAPEATPAAVPSDVSAEAARAASVSTATWRDTLSDDLKANPTLAKYETLESALKGHVELQSAFGKKTEGLVKPPSADAKPEEVAAWRKALGVPEAPEGYSATLPPGLGADPATLATFQKIAHDNHLTPAQFQKLVQFDLDRHQAMVDRQVVSAKTAEATLRKEWGGAYDHKLAMLQRFAESVGGAELITDLELRGKGASLPVLKLLDKMATLAQEHGMTPGMSVSPITSADADRRIAEIRADKDYASNFDNPERHTHLIKELDKLIHLRK